MKKTENTAFIYLRLSRDDNLDGESYSISNQKKLLTSVAKSKGYTNIVPFIDDGVSGVTMKRTGLQKMLNEIENKKASAVLVKDMSRLGRNYIEVGRLTEEFFPENDIRLIAVSDNIDTDEGENELTPIRNLFNEWYAKDISKKRRISNKIKGTSGEPMGKPPYGYIKNPENPKSWIVDEYSANIVRKIYSMYLDGMGTTQIAGELTNEKILSPYFYWLDRGLVVPRKTQPKNEPWFWNTSTIIKMLNIQEYCGDVINFKTYTKSYKNKKRYDNDVENMMIFKNVHEPIISREIFEKVQAKKGTRNKPTADGEKNMFSGLLVCGDCGHNLHYHFNQGNHDIKYFSCSNYKGNRGTCNDTHYIRVDFLEQIVFAEIKRLLKYSTKYEDVFTKAVMGYTANANQSKLDLQEKDLRKLMARYNQLDVLFERIYEDNVEGKISDERFKKMSTKYEEEQAELKEKISFLKKEMKKIENQSTTTDDFLKAVRKYTRVKKLNTRMLNDLIEKIEVFKAEKINAIKKQKITIHYNCVDVIDIPKDIPIDIPNIKIPTRQGVVLKYDTD